MLILFFYIFSLHIDKSWSADHTLSGAAVAHTFEGAKVVLKLGLNAFGFLVVVD